MQTGMAISFLMFYTDFENCGQKEGVELTGFGTKENENDIERESLGLQATNAGDTLQKPLINPPNREFIDKLNLSTRSLKVKNISIFNLISNFRIAMNVIQTFIQLAQ